MVKFCKEELNAMVESYLNDDIDHCELELYSTSNARERFIVNTAKRLINAVNLYRNGKCSVNDVLMSMRNYLLVLQTSMSVRTISIPKDNVFGIYENASSGKYHAAFEFPEYVNDKFVKDVFMADGASSYREPHGFNLNTNAFIRKLTSFTTFKSVAQKLAVCGALNTPPGFTALISLPTGGGKSLITQTVAYQYSDLTVAIVPTVSLALDQVRVCKSLLKTRDVDAEVFSYSGGDNLGPFLEAVKNRTARILFTSPEAVMTNKRIKDVLKKAASDHYLKSIVIDEAHIVVDWGALFRVDYQCLECWRKNLMRENPEIRTILLSATFEEQGVAVLKSLFSSGEDKWIEIRCDALRHEPRFMHIRTSSEADKNKRLLDLIRKMPHPLIAYVDSPYEAERIKALLIGAGITNAKTYTGTTLPKARRVLIDEWTDDEFEIMVATSAFGVGVDKPDVRTVLHLYVPQNPNAYYQELGRGGRDKLPCLSIMCVGKADLDSARGRISKKVLTTQHIVDRWQSMLFSKKTLYKKESIIINTAVLPNYTEENYFEDRPVSGQHQDWNINVLLFLRRYGLINIRDVIPQGDEYVFVVRILDDLLLSTNRENLEQGLDSFREAEYKAHKDAYATMSRAIQHSKTECWSEMFYDTYHYVLEYCAGCNEHGDVKAFDKGEFPLKKKLAAPIRQLDNEQLSIFSGAKEAIVLVPEDQNTKLFKMLSRYRISALVTMDETGLDGYAGLLEDNANIIVLDPVFAKKLIIDGMFYLSGVVVVKYSGSPQEVFELYRYFARTLGNRDGVRLLHVVTEDYYFGRIYKKLTDIVDGPVLSLHMLK